MLQKIIAQFGFYGDEAPKLKNMHPPRGGKQKTSGLRALDYHMQRIVEFKVDQSAINQPRIAHVQGGSKVNG